GIEDTISRADLADRAVFLNLSPIAEEERRSEAELWREFEVKRPSIMGALLDAVATGLRHLPRLRLERLPRMADFALWATACESVIWPAGTFMRAYETNRKATIADAVDADPVAACVREIMAERSSWTGSAADLLREGADLAGDGVLITNWPTNPRALAGRLRRAQTFFGRSGSRSPSAARVAPVAGLSECAGSSKKPSAPSATVSTIEQDHDQDTQRQDRSATFPPATPHPDPARSAAPILGCPPLTVLT